MAIKDAKNKMIKKVLVAVFVLFGTALLVFGISFIQEARLAATWPSVEGKVVATGLRTSSGRNSSRRYYAQVQYRYSVDGRTFSGNRYRLGDGPNTGNFNDAEDAKEAAKKWPAGSAVQVYYDPDNPSSAVLEPHASWGVYVPLVLGSFFLGIMILLTLGVGGQKGKE